MWCQEIISIHSFHKPATTFSSIAETIILNGLISMKAIYYTNPIYAVIEKLYSRYEEQSSYQVNTDDYSMKKSHHIIHFLSATYPYISVSKRKKGVLPFGYID